MSLRGQIDEVGEEEGRCWETLWGHWTQRVRTSVSSPRGRCSRSPLHIHTALLSEELATQHALARTHSTHQRALGGAIELCLKTRSTKPEHENASGITLASLTTLRRRKTTTVDGHRSPLGSLYSLTRVGGGSSKASVVQRMLGVTAASANFSMIPRRSQTRVWFHFSWEPSKEN